MTGSSDPETFPTPTIMPLGDSGLLVRFGSALTDAANRAAIVLAVALERDPIAGVVEIVPNLVSVLLRYDPWASAPAAIAGELRLRLFALGDTPVPGASWTIPTRFDGPDLDEVAAMLGMAAPDFVAAHNAKPLRVLATGFAPGFVYCGLHGEGLVVPRRTDVRPAVPPGSVLFAAGQTAVTATEMPTGWYVIGHTDFRNFDPAGAPPTRLRPGDMVAFEAAP
ncbi:allophanate hydrolase subunit 1 [Devosia ginsengisoli]|uniref:5-oxoprolinase subunit B family protein n=1 Tax=Devosia ginsengisoli TaxID=400770 RepID=UPI0026ECBC6E|nr:carboxyltransferase domain-containing protein [Devosia ginsengisoli]MCR6672765.1 allophanate hydrolase subunit 1 [Devosia ginsengisoli]